MPLTKWSLASGPSQRRRRPPSRRPRRSPRQAAVVSVQVRTGTEYVDLGWTPPYGWYRAAAELLSERVGSVGFVIASDVPLAAAAVVAAFSDLGPAGVLPTISAYDTIRALGLADHAIVSPSSLAWWGAWLGDHRTSFDDDRIVVAP